eukprot:TRINITY_DN31641_c0_g1_i1.p1 TRINITY_DN31641_c0_g1~~TRINITY_DN31641_c0_g1_i1.p1  ORF type:complete len:471 (+),score=80.09 TRINITY_DN31641_c0_g1_i1:48-1415(+)
MPTFRRLTPVTVEYTTGLNRILIDVDKKLSYGFWGDVDVVLISNTEGVRGAPRGTEAEGYQGRIIMSPSVRDMSSMLLQDEGYRPCEIQRFMERIEVTYGGPIEIDDATIHPKPIESAYGELAWEIEHTPTGHRTLITTSGAPLVTSPVDTFVCIPPIMSAVQVPSLLDEVSLTVIEERHVFIPFYLSHLSFSVVKYASELAAARHRATCYLVTKHKQAFSELYSRVYEAMPARDADALRLPDKPGMVKQCVFVHPDGLDLHLRSVRACVFMFLDPDGLQRAGVLEKTQQQTKGCPATLFYNIEETKIDAVKDFANSNGNYAVKVLGVSYPFPSLRSVVPHGRYAPQAVALVEGHSVEVAVKRKKRPFSAVLQTDQGIGGVPSPEYSAGAPSWDLGPSTMQVNGASLRIVRTAPNATPLKMHHARVGSDGTVLFNDKATCVDIEAVKTKLDSLAP